MRTRSVQPTEAHRLFHEDALALLNKHSGALEAKEMLAIASHLVGQIIAMQDQRTMTLETIWAIVGRNIEVGNDEVVAYLRGKTAGNG